VGSLQHQAVAADVGAVEAASVQLGKLLAGLLVSGQVAQLFLRKRQTAGHGLLLLLVFVVCDRVSGAVAGVARLLLVVIHG
jgi:hypothetical protein